MEVVKFGVGMASHQVRLWGKQPVKVQDVNPLPTSMNITWHTY